MTNIEIKLRVDTLPHNQYAVVGELIDRTVSTPVYSKIVYNENL